MSVVLTMLAVVATALALYIGVGLLVTRKKICPGCHVRGLATDMHGSVLGTAVNDEGQRYPYSISAYRCTACRAEWRAYNNNGLVTKEAYDRGAREPIPAATVRTPEPGDDR